MPFTKHVNFVHRHLFRLKTYMKNFGWCGDREQNKTKNKIK